MITERCNLNCKYCFANEFVNLDESADISLSDFKNILSFILKDGSDTKVGVIGGEPTLHSGFNEILDILAKDRRIKDVMIYTNGIMLKNYVERLSDPKFHLLINCNDIDKKSLYYKDFIESLDLVFGKMPERIILGSNFYKIGYDYQYIIDLLKKYSSKRLRVSISVPNTEEYDYAPLEYFAKIKPEIFSYFRELKKIGTIPFLDCNILPACLVSASEMREFDEWGAENPLSILKNRQTGCMPVIDILPDYTAVRCFGLSKYTKVSIKDFASISDLRNYYLRIIDAIAVNTVYDIKCENCYKHKTLKCSGGCLIYKIDRILSKKDGMGYGGM